MMRRVVSPQAAHDIRTIFNSLAGKSENAARRLVADIDKALDLLADMPEAGHIRSDLTTKSVRFWSIRKRYLVVYRIVPTGILVVRVLDGHRHVENILG